SCPFTFTSDSAFCMDLTLPVFFFQAEDGIRDATVTGVQTCALPISLTARNTPAGVQLTGEVPSHDFHARLWINFEVSVPRNYNLDVLTQAGNIETSDIDGRVTLVT